MKRLKKTSILSTGAVVIALVILFVISVIWFRSPKETIDDRLDSISDILRPDPISQTLLNGAIDTKSKTAQLYLLQSSEVSGQARRGIKDGRYFFEMKSSLPEIDRQVYFYNVWIVRQIPYDFFSLGEMVTNDDGEFVLAWEAQDNEDYMSYTEVVVTLQEYGGVSDPQQHIVEGEFREIR